jgi:hypothetical protein
MPDKKNQPESVKGRVARAASRNARKNPNRGVWGNTTIKRERATVAAARVN